MTLPAWPPWSEQRARLEAAGFRPSRRLGQNFLRDPSVARAIARDSEVEAGAFVLEIGPGMGVLSHALLERGARLTCVEIDPRLLEIARTHTGGEAKFLRADVLAGKHKLEPSVLELLPKTEPWQLVANLPYSVSAPALCVLSDLENPPERITALIQKEMADRICASHGTSDWGPISVRLQHAYETSMTRKVSADVFWPRPKVESGVVQLTRRKPSPDSLETARLARLVEGLFQRRRQRLGRVLGDALGKERGGRAAADALLLELDLDGGCRAETLDLSCLLAIANSHLWSGGE